MTWWQIALLVAGLLWTVAGTAITALVLVFKDGFMGSSGPGWGGVALMAGISLVGPGLIVYAAVHP